MLRIIVLQKAHTWNGYLFSESALNILQEFSFLSGFSFRNIHDSMTTGETGGHFFESSLPLPSASQALRY